MRLALATRPPKLIADNFHQTDLSDEPAASGVVDLIFKYGPPKIVVHNTAEWVIAPFPETRLSDYPRK